MVWTEQKLGLMEWATETSWGVASLLPNFFFPTQDNSTQRSLQWECSCRAVHKLGLEQRQRAWVKGAEALWMEARHPEKKMGELFPQWRGKNVARGKKKLGEVLGLLTKDNLSSQKQATGFLLAIWFFKNETSKLLFVQKGPFKSPSPENSDLNWYWCSAPMPWWVEQHLGDQCIPPPACLVLQVEKYWNTWKPASRSLVENMQTAGKVALVQWATYKLNPSRLIWWSSKEMRKVKLNYEWQRTKASVPAGCRTDVSEAQHMCTEKG